MKHQIDLTIPEALILSQYVAAVFYTNDSDRVAIETVPAVFIDGPAPSMRIDGEGCDKLLEYVIGLFWEIENDDLAAARCRLMDKLRQVVAATPAMPRP